MMLRAGEFGMEFEGPVISASYSSPGFCEDAQHTMDNARMAVTNQGDWAGGRFSAA